MTQRLFAIRIAEIKENHKGEKIDGKKEQLTFAVFLVAPALLWGKGAGVAFLPCLGGCH